ncbi:MAG: HIT domain-containing protein [Planctomycetes bacterium]|nr:HIT domain-containing protein [Planctomycetota bacterium]
MDEQRIWAPWRIGYIAGDDRPSEPLAPAAWLEGSDEQCFMCRAAASYEAVDTAQRENLVVHAGKHCLVMLNRYPYTNGHLLVAPLRHVGELHELSDDEHLEAMQTLARFTQLLSTLISAEGFNVGLNLGQVAGAGVPGHLHWHLVPRWSGDNNFMPTVAGVRMIPQSLEAMWESLVEAV